MTSDLYFILNPSTGAIKIGIADSVPKRLRSLEQACGVPLDVLGVLVGGSDFERPLHYAFHEDRLLGEWFRPSEALCALADDTSTVGAYLAAHERDVEQGRAKHTAGVAERLKENREIRRARDDSELKLAVAAAHTEAIRENRRIDRARAAKAAKEAARTERHALNTLSAEADRLARSAMVGDRLMARELVAAVAERRTDFARHASPRLSQRLRNAAFNGVARPALR